MQRCSWSLLLLLVLLVRGASGAGRRGTEQQLGEYFKWWLGEAWGEVPAISLKDMGGGNLVMQATQHHNKSEVILKVPKRNIISSDAVRITDKGILLLNLMNKRGIDPVHHDLFLLLYQVLLDKANPTSLYRPLYNIFPSDLSEFPCTWRDEEIGELQAADDIVDGIIYQKRIVEGIMQILIEMEPALMRMYSRYEVLLIYNYLNSRCIMLSKGTLAVNVGDFTNHNATEPTIALSYHDDEYVYWTTRMAVSPGTTFTSDYGIRSNSRALLSYGFVIDDPALFAVDVTVSDPSFSFPLILTLQLQNENRKRIMSAIRQLLTDSANTIQLNYDHLEAVSEKINSSHAVLEKKMLLKLAKTCKYSLSLFPTTMLEDFDILKSYTNSSSTNIKNAILYRIGKKKILHHYFDMATVALRLLTSRTAKIFRSNIDDCVLHCHPITIDYCWSVVFPLFSHAYLRSNK